MTISFLKQSHTGFTLLEMLVAILIFSAALVSLIVIAGRGVSATATAKDQMVAHFLAQEGVEVVRNIRDSNFLQGIKWDTGLELCVNDVCNIDYTTEPPSLLRCSSCEVLQDIRGFYTNGTPSGFTREIQLLEQKSTDFEEYLVRSTVSFNAKGIPHSVVLQTIIKNWR